MRRFYCPEFGSHGFADLPVDEARHLVTVLRATVGVEITILDGRGNVAGAIVREISGSRKSPRVRVEIDSYESVFESVYQICLYVACPRTKQMELILRQATELGVVEIHPIITEFTVSRPEKNSSKWESILIEAMKQSGNPFLPKLFPVTSLGDALRDGAPEFGYYGAVPSELDFELSYTEEPRAYHRLALWVGPEGGFSPDELKMIRRQTVDRDGQHLHCFRPKTIGRNILRIETAVTAGIATILCEELSE
jgi:16S rRNA (uracil1498-N3)-methyltransferase